MGEVGMSIDKTREDSLSFKIDLFRIRPCQSENLFCPSRRNKSFALDGDGLLNGEVVIYRHNLAIEEYLVRPQIDLFRLVTLLLRG
jgi:hypothetical protein